ncbi:ABC transporter substrate-binding protein [Rhodococcus pyridinivorans]
MAEHGVLFNMLGPDPVIDESAKQITGPLFVDNEYAGVNMQIRSGGPAIGFQTVPSRMYQDESITFGVVDTDQSIQASDTTPTTAVYSAFEISPTMIMWDPATYPDVHSIADLRSTGAKVLHSTGVTYMDYLTGAGILDKSQADSSYDGSSANFVAAAGKAAQQGFASQEPYTYEHSVQGWNKPVDFQLIHDAGYPTYTSPLVVRTGELDEYSSCLKELVPAFQRSMVDYYQSPQDTLDLIIETRDAYNTSGTEYTMDNGMNSITMTQKLGLVGNGPSGTHGAFDMTRVQKMLDITEPIFAAQGVSVPESLTADDLATNEFVDPSITFVSTIPAS